MRNPRRGHSLSTSLIHVMTGESLSLRKLVHFIRSISLTTAQQKAEQTATASTAHYVGSAACEKCHAQIYERWKKTPMANLYFVANGTDWRSTLYPPDNMERPTGPTCDGCNSVNYYIQTKQVAEWNVGCEKCHGPGSTHVEQPTRGNIVNPARMDYISANDTASSATRKDARSPVPSKENITTGRSASISDSTSRIIGSLKSTISARLRSLILQMARRTRTACRAMTSCKA